MYHGRVGKRGVGYLLNATNLGGIGGQRGQSAIRTAFGAGLPHFSSLSLGNGTAFVATLNGVTAVSGA